MVKKLYNILTVLVGLGVFLLLPSTVLAATISQGYNSTQTITGGSVVALENDNLVLATNQNSRNLLGVVVTAPDSLVNLDATKNVQVVSSGRALTLVSDINGEIKAGDKLAPSPVAGVAMRASESGKILGTSAQDFGSQEAVQTENIQDKHGKSQTVHIGSVPADIGVADYQVVGTGTSAVVTGLQTIASTASGKQVTALRAILAALVLVLALIVSVIVLYSGVSSSIRSIGRNPLSKKFVVQGLVQVIIAVFIIMIAAFSVVYIIIGS